MSDIDIEYLRSWIGQSRQDQDLIATRHARLMAATVNHPESAALVDGAELPPLWHWLYFLEGQPADRLGRDGHPARGQFLPPVPLANRMWAGGRLDFLAPVQLGTQVRKTSSILRVEHKTGRSGDLVFVTVLHELTAADGRPLVREEHDIVYKNKSPAPPAPPRSAGAADTPHAATGGARRSLKPDSTQLFRYSALTFNGHRIHYDADYCRQVEGYPELVIHGPLLATLLAGFAIETSHRSLRHFTYRALAPALLGDVLTLQAEAQPDQLVLAATVDRGITCMQAEAVLA
ncbi:MAG TPA: MaoC family dehydratase N-terminal domain-containing protein [Accumulibacter sp.]|nr:MaoC family dehydratase N-terminal domain-containing protein [Accumulibacter sp.]